MHITDFISLVCQLICAGCSIIGLIYTCRKVKAEQLTKKKIEPSVAADDSICSKSNDV